MKIAVALEHHLCFNHYPAINRAFVPTAQRAIELANEDDWDTEIELPNGIIKPVSEIVDELHLYDFLDCAD